MEILEIEFILFGLSDREEIINNILDRLNRKEYVFHIKLILTEALTNAFKHGNKGNINKPIYLRCFYNINSIKFEIEDSGEGFDEKVIPKEINEEDLLREGGRGLFLIKSLVNDLKINGNILILKKYL